MRAIIPAHRDRAQLVTEARPSLSQDIAYRQRRYLIMMGIRVVCFAAAVALFVNVPGFYWAIPVVGAIIIPYFAVIFANGGREPSSSTGFRAYEPRLPVPRGPGGPRVEPGPAGPVDAGPDPGSFTGSNHQPKGGQENG